jgi:hypothetical protein
MNLVVLRQYRLVYLATPYRKYPGGLQVACEAAADVAARLYRNGVKVLPPIPCTHLMAKHSSLNPTDNSLWWPLNRAYLSVCDALAVVELETWRESDGIRDEIEEFKQAQKPIYYINPNSLMVRK